MKHVFTREETLQGARSSKRSRAKLYREIKKITGLEIQGDVLLALVSNPAVVGSVLFFIVHQLNQPDASKSNPWVTSFLTNLSNAIPGVNLVGGGSLGLDALEAALAVYVASGGNLAGVLSSSAGIVSKLLPTIVK